MWPKFLESKPKRPTSAPPVFSGAPSGASWDTYAGFVCLQADDPPTAAGRGANMVKKDSNEDIPYIPAEGGLPQVNLTAKMRELMDHCWKVATVPNAGPQAPALLAAGRAQAFQRTQNSQNPSDMARATRLQQHEHVKQVNPLGVGRGTYPQDWNLANQLQRVNAYTFRGEQDRTPREVEAAGGFFPPITRTDQSYVDGTIYPHYAFYLKSRFGMTISKEEFTRIYNRVVVSKDDRDALKLFLSWQAMVSNEADHIGRMVGSQVLKNFISTSRSPGVAKTFAGPGGWVYVVRVRGAFNLTNGHAYNAKWLEQECSLPGFLPWGDVFGFRKSNGAWLTGPLWLRASLKGANPSAYSKVFAALSNRTMIL